MLLMLHHYIKCFFTTVRKGREELHNMNLEIVSHSKGELCAVAERGVVRTVHGCLSGEPGVKLANVLVWLLHTHAHTQTDGKTNTVKQCCMWNESVFEEGSEDIDKPTYVLTRWQAETYQLWLVWWLHSLVQQVIPVNVFEEQMFLQRTRRAAHLHTSRS